VVLDDLFFRALPHPSNTRWVDLIRFNSFWHYQSATPGGNWTATNFNANNWPEGIAKFGCGGGPQDVLTALPPGRPAYYFRKAFIANAAKYDELLLTATCTDSYGGQSHPLRLFINGHELETTGIETISEQGNRREYFDLQPFASLLRPGTNHIAVILGNCLTDGWDDVAFDLSLKAIPAVDAPSLGKVQSVQSSSQGMLLNVLTGPGTSWRLESTDALLPRPVWQLVDRINSPAGGLTAILDFGQNGRRLPSQTTCRMYRLIPD
jgi:hypothetical protein